MYILLRRFFSSVLLRISWKVILCLFICLFFASWGAMYYFEGDAEFVQPQVYWWFWLVTCTTVGYGDYSPVTLGGRIIAGVVMVLGIGIFAVILGKIAETIIEQSRKIKKGLLMLDAKDHVVILGYRKGETERLVEELTSDTWTREQIALVSSQATENPLNKGVRFVHGDFMQPATLEKAGVADARCIIIHGHSDDQTLATGIAVHGLIKDRDPDSISVTAYFQNPDREQYLKTVSDRITFVHSLSVPILAQSVTDPGSVETLQKLTSGNDGATLFTIVVPEAWHTNQFEGMRNTFYCEHDATLIGIQQKGESLRLNPNGGTQLNTGDVLHYIAHKRIEQSALVA